jgi:hypothetical protein
MKLGYLIEGERSKGEESKEGGSRNNEDQTTNNLTRWSLWFCHACRLRSLRFPLPPFPNPLSPPTTLYVILCGQEEFGMAIEFRCGQCGRLLRTGDDTAGRMAQCPECGSQTPVPVPPEPEEELLTPSSIEPPPASPTQSSPFGDSFGHPQPSDNPYHSPTQPIPPRSDPNDKKGLAIASLVLGIVGLMTGCCWLLGLPCSVIGLILGLIAMKSSNSSNRTLAIIGVVLSSLGILIGLAAAIFGIVMALNDHGQPPMGHPPRFR